MRVQLLWLTATVCIAASGIAVASPPADVSTHHDVKKSIPAEYGSEDEEVRQLLDLKGLAAQRDLGSLKRSEEKSTDVTPSSADSSSSSSSSDSSPADGLKGSPDQKVEAKPGVLKDKEGEVHENAESEKTISSIMENLSKRDQLEAIDPRDQIPLKEHELQRQHARYNPLELALYVYKTGDEETVTDTIQELIVSGVMTAEEALNYLREIRDNLRYLNLQDEQEQGRGEEEDVNVMSFRPLMKKNSLPLPLTEMNLGDPETMLAPDEDYSFLMERSRSQESASTENSLEEVIYQLAKIVFKQAMSKDISSEKALQEIAALLERETARGAITPEAEKKVLDILVNSLVDSMGENEFPSGPGPLLGGVNFRLPNQSPFSLGDSPLSGGTSFKHNRDLFELSKTTTKREAPSDIQKKAQEDKY